MTDEDEERWCAEQRSNVVAYLAGEKCASTSVSEWPSVDAPSDASDKFGRIGT
jgi:hypothetical protein